MHVKSNWEKERRGYMSQCALCKKNIAKGGEIHSFHTAKKLREIKYRTGTVEKTTTVYGDFVSHLFSTCHTCNLKGRIIAALTLPAAALWIFTMAVAPMNNIRFLIPSHLFEMKFSIWMLLIGIIYLLLFLGVTYYIIWAGFTWRGRKLKKRAFEYRGVKWGETYLYQTFSENEYRKLKPYQKG